MPSLDEIAPNFRRAQQRWPEAPTLAAAYEAMGVCVDGNGHGIPEHIKSFIECVCLTIMGEYGEPMPSSNPSATELLVAAFRALGLENSRGTSRLDKVLSALNRVSDAITEMRNENGPVAHGKDGFLECVGSDSMRSYLLAADVVLGALLAALEGTQPDLMFTREPYETFSRLNTSIDESVCVQADVELEENDQNTIVISVQVLGADEPIELRIEPSRLLYQVDRGAYVEAVKAALPPRELSDEGISSSEPSLDAVVSGHLRAQPLRPPEPISTYAGPLEPLRGPLAGFLAAEGLDPSASLEEGGLLGDSVLLLLEETAAGLDWKQREMLQSRLSVSIGRLLRRFGVEPGRAREIADKTVAWAQVQVSGSMDGGDDESVH